MISACHQLRMLHAVLCYEGQALLNRDTGRNLWKLASLLPLETWEMQSRKLLDWHGERRVPRFAAHVRRPSALLHVIGLPHD